MIQIKNIIKNFKNIEVLHDVSFDIHDEEIIGLIGPNGAGKSTLINIMLGLLQTDSGHIDFGFDRKTEVGVMQQTDSFPIDLNAVELIKMHTSFYDKKMSTDEIKNKLKAIGLIERSTTLIKNLSGGEKRRLSFLLSIIHNPRFIILDEPTNAMDIESVELLWKKIFLLKNEGCTIIIISHDLDQIDRFVDRAIILDNHQVAFDDALTNLHKKKVLDYIIQDPICNVKDIEIIHRSGNNVCIHKETSICFEKDLTKNNITFLKKERFMTIRDMYRCKVEVNKHDNEL